MKDHFYRTFKFKTRVQSPSHTITFSKFNHFSFLLSFSLSFQDSSKMLIYIYSKSNSKKEKLFPSFLFSLQLEVFNVQLEIIHLFINYSYFKLVIFYRNIKETFGLERGLFRFKIERRSVNCFSHLPFQLSLERAQLKIKINF